MKCIQWTEARRLLQERLTLRGVTLSSGLTLVAAMSVGKAEAAGFAEATVRVALSLILNETPSALASMRVSGGISCNCMGIRVVASRF
jgi:hypothetical protein